MSFIETPTKFATATEWRDFIASLKAVLAEHPDDEQFLKELSEAEAWLSEIEAEK